MATTVTAIKFVHEYEVRPRKDERGVDLIPEVIPFGRLWYVRPYCTSCPLEFL